MPFWDEWMIVPLLKKFTSNTLTFADLFSRHNEHRMFFPRILILLAVFMTKNYNSLVFMYVVQIFFGLILFVLYLQAKQQFHFTLRTLPIWFIPIPFFVFSWRQWENMLWGFQVTFVMPLLFSIVSLYYLHRLAALQINVAFRTVLLYFVVAVICAIIASFSMSMGLFIWIAGMCQFVIVHWVRFKKVFVTLWGIIGISVWMIYFEGSFSHSWLNSSKEGINMFVCGKLFVSLLGSFFYDKSHALLYGMVLLLLFTLVLFSLVKLGRIRENAFWISLAIYSLSVLLAITIGRSRFGAEFIMWSRYNTYTIPFIIALYVLATITVTDNRYVRNIIWNRIPSLLLYCRKCDDYRHIFFIFQRL